LICIEFPDHGGPLDSQPYGKSNQPGRRPGFNVTLAVARDDGRTEKPGSTLLSTPIDLEHLARYTGGEKTLNAEILRLFDS
jgi:hypothetical protein